MQSFYKLFGNEDITNIEIIPEEKADIDQLLEDRKTAIEEKTRLLTDGSRSYVELSDEEKQKVVSDRVETLNSITDDTDSIVATLASAVLKDIPQHGQAVVNIASIVRATKTNLAMIKGYTSLLSHDHLSRYVNILGTLAQSYYTFNGVNEIANLVNVDALPPMFDDKEGTIDFDFDNTLPKVCTKDVATAIAITPVIMSRLVYLNKYVIARMGETQYNDDPSNWYNASYATIEGSMNGKILKYAVEMNKIFMNQLNDMHDTAVRYANDIDNSQLKTLVDDLTATYTLICDDVRMTFNTDRLEANSEFINKLIGNERVTSRLSEGVRSVATIVSNLIRSIITNIAAYAVMMCGVMSKLMYQIRDNSFAKEATMKLNTIADKKYRVSIGSNKEVTCVKIVNMDTGDEQYFDLSSRTSLVPKLTPSENIDKSMAMVELPIRKNGLNEFVNSLKQNSFEVNGVITSFKEVEAVTNDELSIINGFYDTLSNYVENRNGSDKINFKDSITAMYDGYRRLLYNDTLYKDLDVPDPSFKFEGHKLENPTEDFTSFKNECDNLCDWVKFADLKKEEHIISYDRMAKLYGDKNLYSAMQKTSTNIQRYKVDRKWDKLQSDFAKLAKDCETNDNAELRARTAVAQQVARVGACLIKGTFDVVANTYKYATLFNKYELNSFFTGFVIIDLVLKIATNNQQAK